MRRRTDAFDPDLTQLAAITQALGHPARLLILRTLAAERSCVCGELVEVLPLSQSTVSQHLKKLKEAGLIKGEIEGPRSCYCIDQQALARFTSSLGALLAELRHDPPGEACCAPPTGRRDQQVPATPVKKRKPR